MTFNWGGIMGNGRYRQSWEGYRYITDIESLQYFLRQRELKKDRRWEDIGTLKVTLMVA